MKFNVKIEQEVEAKVIEVHAKVSDSGSYILRDAKGIKIKESDGYVPGFFPGQHYGDYLMFEIDIDTGTILNWKKPTEEQLREFVDSED